MCWYLVIFSMVVLYFANEANSKAGDGDDSEVLRQITNKIDMLTKSQDDFHSKIDRNNKRHDDDLTSLKNSLEVIKELIEGRKENRSPGNINRDNERDNKFSDLLSNNVGDELNKLIKKLMDAQHSDLQDVKDALRYETTELRDQFEKQNRLLNELENKFRNLEQLKSNTEGVPNRKSDDIGDELNKIVNNQQNELKDVANTLQNATIKMQEELQMQSQLLKELQEKFNRMGGYGNVEKPREYNPPVRPSYSKNNYSTFANDAKRKPPRNDQCNCQPDFQKLKREMQTEFQKQGRQLAEVLDKVNQMDQQMKVKLEKESYTLKNEMGAEFQKQSRLILEMQEKLNKVGQQVKSKLEIESKTIKNGLLEELQNQNRVLLDIQEHFNRTEKDIKVKLEMDAKRGDNLIMKFDQTKAELANNIKDIRESLNDEFQKQLLRHNSLLADLKDKFKQMTQQIKDELSSGVTYIVETLVDRISEMKEDMLTQQNNDLAEIRDVLLNEMRDNSQKESRQLDELKGKFEQQIARDSEKERNINDKLNEMQKAILSEQQNRLRDFKDALEHELQNELEKLNPRLVELKSLLNKVVQQINKMPNPDEELSKIRDMFKDVPSITAEALAKNINQMKEVMKDLLQNKLRDELNKLKNELLVEQQRELQNGRDTQTKELHEEFEREFDLLRKLQENCNDMNEDLRDLRKLVDQINDILARN